jgi:leucyl aminopeptidase
MDITATKDLGAQRLQVSGSVEFPKKCVQQKDVKKLAKHLDTAPMKANLEKLTSFHTRYYNSDWGLKSSDWVLQRVNDMIKEAGAEKTVTAQSFPHTWKQHSVIATIPGQTNSTIVIGAHQDSINLWLPILAAPGADDDGSGTVTSPRMSWKARLPTRLSSIGTVPRKAASSAAKPSSSSTRLSDAM